MFCTPRFTYFYALKVVPWHYNLILCDSASFLCTFPVESVFITGSFHPAVYPSPPASCRDKRDFPQAQPCLDLESETAPCSSICVAVSQPDGIKNESCCSKQGTRSVWPLPQASCAPLSCRFLSQSGCGCQVFLLTAGPPALSTLFALTHHMYA